MKNKKMSVEEFRRLYEGMLAENKYNKWVSGLIEFLMNDISISRINCDDPYMYIYNRRHDVGKMNVEELYNRDVPYEDILEILILNKTIIRQERNES